MKHGTYIGPDCGWNVKPGMGACLMPSSDPKLTLAQFDDFFAQRNGVDLAFGWHEFLIEHFKVDENVSQ